MKFRQLSLRRFSDPEVEAAHRDTHEAVRELQTVVEKRTGDVISDITLIDSTPTPVAHRLGRPPKFVGPSVVRGATAAGFITEVRNSAYDRSRVIVLQATGYGATITLDVEVK